MIVKILLKYFVISDSIYYARYVKILICLIYKYITVAPHFAGHKILSKRYAEDIL